MSKNVFEITDESFEEEVLKSDKIVLLDLWAEWCGPCKMMGPVVDQLADENENIKFVKINVDLHPNTSAKYGIRAIPTFLLFKNGVMVDKVVGAVSKQTLSDKLNQQLN